MVATRRTRGAAAAVVVPEPEPEREPSPEPEAAPSPVAEPVPAVTSDEPTTGNPVETMDEDEAPVVVAQEDEVEVKPEETKTEDVDMADALPEGASEVLYINNLNEKIKLEGPSPVVSPHA